MAVDVLKVTGDYKIVTSSVPGTKLTMDTPEVRITGDLTVLGNTTTIETANMTVEDNIITINSGETSLTGISLGQAGLNIYRGPSSSAATLLFDDTLSYIQPNGNTGPGVFTFKVGSGLGALQAHVLETTGEDLILLGQSAPNAVVSVTGTADYENNVTDDDDIPNKKYVDTAVSGAAIARILTGNTKAQVYDTSTGAPLSEFTVEIDGVEKFSVNAITTELQDITIDGTTIRPKNSNSSLFLETNGTGEVVVRDVLSIEGAVAPSAPSADSGRIKLYSQTEAEGGSGLYFVNTSSTRDELVSKKKALLYSMLF
jgi:hypothetical protein